MNHFLHEFHVPNNQRNSYYPFLNQVNLMHNSWIAQNILPYIINVWEWAKNMILSVSMFSI